MLQWEYNHKDYLDGGFKPIEPGKYRVRIEKAEEGTSKSSNKPMIKLTLKVSGQVGSVWHYITLDADNKERTNKNLGDIFESFGLNFGDMNLQHWIGKVGGAMLKQEPFNDTMQTKVSYFIKRDQQAGLAPWQEKPTGHVEPEMMSFDGANPNNVPF